MTESKVTLHGFWASPYVKRVQLALKVKGIDFDYVEENLINKSPLLVKYNPVHKKVPVLVHNGNPIVESSVILEYIDETWKDGPPLLPKDPYERAQVRFWDNFIHQQLVEPLFKVLKTEGEPQEEAAAEVHEKLKILEEGIKGSFRGGSPCINGENMGHLDIVMCSIFGSHKALEEVLGIKLIDSEKYPLVTSWVKGFAEISIVKEVTLPFEQHVAFLRRIRNKFLQTSIA